MMTYIYCKFRLTLDNISIPLLIFFLFQLTLKKMAEGLKVDPAIEKWAHLRENTHLYFSFNKRNTRRSLFWGIAIPVGLTILAYQTDVCTDNTR